MQTTEALMNHFPELLEKVPKDMRTLLSKAYTLQVGPSLEVPYQFSVKHQELVHFWHTKPTGLAYGLDALAATVAAIPLNYFCKDRLFAKLVQLIRLALDMRKAVAMATRTATGHRLAFFSEPHEVLDYMSMRMHLWLLITTGHIDFDTHGPAVLTVTRLETALGVQPELPYQASCPMDLAAPGIKRLSHRQRMTIQGMLDRWEHRGLSDLVVGGDQGLNIMLRTANQSYDAFKTTRLVLSDPFGSGRAVSALTVALVLIQQKKVQRVAVVCEQFVKELWWVKIKRVLPDRMHRRVVVISEGDAVKRDEFDLCIVDESDDSVRSTLQQVRAFNTMRDYIFIRHLNTLNELCDCIAFDNPNARTLLREAMHCTQLQANELFRRLTSQTSRHETAPDGMIVKVGLSCEEQRRYLDACERLRVVETPTTNMTPAELQAWLQRRYVMRVQLLRDLVSGTPCHNVWLPCEGPPMDQTGNDDESGCVVCMSPPICKTTLTCGHSFCQGCIVDWLCSNNVCPMCRCGIETITFDAATQATPMEMVNLAPLNSKVDALMDIVREERHVKKTVVVAHNSETAKSVATVLDVKWGGLRQNARYITKTMRGECVLETIRWFQKSDVGVLVVDPDVLKAGLDIGAWRVIILSLDRRHDRAIMAMTPREWVRIACKETIDMEVDLTTLGSMMAVLYNRED